MDISPSGSAKKGAAIGRRTDRMKTREFSLRRLLLLLLLHFVRIFFGVWQLSLLQRAHTNALVLLVHITPTFTCSSMFSHFVFLFFFCCALSFTQEFKKQFPLSHSNANQIDFDPRFYSTADRNEEKNVLHRKKSSETNLIVRFHRVYVAYFEVQLVTNSPSCLVVRVNEHNWIPKRSNKHGWGLILIQFHVYFLLIFLGEWTAEYKHITVLYTWYNTDYISCTSWQLWNCENSTWTR